METTHSEYLILNESFNQLNKFVKLTSKTSLIDNSSETKKLEYISKKIKKYNFSKLKVIDRSIFEDRIFDSFYKIKSRCQRSFFDLESQKNITELEDWSYRCDKHKYIVFETYKGNSKWRGWDITVFDKINNGYILENEDLNKISILTDNCDECCFYSKINNDFLNEKNLLHENNLFDDVYDYYNSDKTIDTEDELNDFLLIRQDCPFAKDYTTIHRLAINLIEIKLKEKMSKAFIDIVELNNQYTKELNEINNKFNIKIKNYEASKQ